MQDLVAFFAEADTALAKAEDHIRQRAPSSKLLTQVVTLREHVQQFVTITQAQARRVLGPPESDA